MSSYQPIMHCNTSASMQYSAITFGHFQVKVSWWVLCDLNTPWLNCIVSTLSACLKADVFHIFFCTLPFYVIIGFLSSCFFTLFSIFCLFWDCYASNSKAKFLRVKGARVSLGLKVYTLESETALSLCTCIYTAGICIKDRELKLGRHDIEKKLRWYLLFHAVSQSHSHSVLCHPPTLSFRGIYENQHLSFITVVLFIRNPPTMLQCCDVTTFKLRLLLIVLCLGDKQAWNKQILVD